MTWSPNNDSNQPAYPRSLTRVFVVRMKKLCIMGYLNASSDNSDQTAKAQVDLKIHKANISEGMFSAVAADVLVTPCYESVSCLLRLSIPHLDHLEFALLIWLIDLHVNNSISSSLNTVHEI